MAFYRTVRKLTRYIPGTGKHWTEGVRQAPERIVLPVAPGVTPSSKPPVRMFMGTEPRQHRAERVWIWSVEQVRDPSRVYEIYLMKDIAGFDRRLWLTGFTNYRFAIPHWCGGSGRAIYNDVDQIYLADPAQLFDTEMGEHGFLAITERDTSVMLIDCDKMSSVWPLDEIKSERRKAIEAKAKHLWGKLEATWNSRDEEYVEGKSKVLHYTTIHAQPWQPFPERYVYLPNSVGHVWFDLERSADEAGFQVFTAAAPSEEYRDVARRRRGTETTLPVETDEIETILKSPEVRTVLALGLGGSAPALDLAPQQILTYLDLTREDVSSISGKSFDAVLCVDELDFVPVADVPWLVETLFEHARRFVYGSVASYQRSQGIGEETTRSQAFDESWWSWHFAQAAMRHADVDWTLAVQHPRRRRWSDASAQRWTTGWNPSSRLAADRRQGRAHHADGRPRRGARLAVRDQGVALQPPQSHQQPATRRQPAQHRPR